MKSNSFVKRTVAIILVVMMVAAMATAAFAYSSTTKKITSNSWKREYVTVETGSGLFYWLGWKKTHVTVKNTGKNPVYLYKNLGYAGYTFEGSLRPGQTKYFTASGSGMKYSFMFQSTGRQTTVVVSSDAGHVW